MQAQLDWLFRRLPCTEWVRCVQCGGAGREPFNFTPMGVNPISSGSPHVRCTPMGRTCGEPDEIKKNTHPEYFTALFREQVGDGKVKVRRVVANTRTDRPSLNTTPPCHVNRGNLTRTWWCRHRCHLRKRIVRSNCTPTPRTGYGSPLPASTTLRPSCRSVLTVR